MENTKKLLVNNKLGLSPREISKVVITANTFSSDINLEYKGYNIDAKSIMGLLSLLIKNGDQVVLTAKGNDSLEAINHLSSIISEEA